MKKRKLLNRTGRDQTWVVAPFINDPGWLLNYEGKVYSGYSRSACANHSPLIKRAKQAPEFKK